MLRALPHLVPRISAPDPRTRFLVLLFLLLGTQLSSNRRALAGEDAGEASRAKHATVQRAPLPDALDASDAERDLFDAEVLHDIRLRFDTDDWQRELQRNHARALDTPAAFEFDGRRLEPIGVRYKGNTSLEVDGPKKPLNLTLDAFVPGQEIEGVDVINLNNGWGDPSMVREAITYSMLRDFMPVPRVAFSRLFVNDVYVGVYLMVEQIDRAYLATWFPTDDGLLVKADDPSDTRLNSSTLRYSRGLTIYQRGYEIKGGKDPAEGLTEVQDLSRALDAPSGSGGISEEAFETEIRAHLDVDRALWYLAANNLLSNYDSYYAGHNYYLYRGDRDRRWHMLNWDWSLSFGTFQAWYWQLVENPRNLPRIAETSPFDQGDRSDRPLTRRLLSTPAYRADYAAHYRTLLHRLLRPASIEAIGVAFQDQIRDAVREEPQPLQNFSDFERNLWENVRNPVDRSAPASPGILALVSDRHDFLNDAARWPELVPPDVSLVEQAILPEDAIHDVPITLSAVFTATSVIRSVAIHYRVRGGPETRLPMRALAGEGEERQTWRATLPPQDPGRSVDYAYRASLEDGRAIFFPEDNLTRPFRFEVAGVSLPEAPPGDLILNELMADNEQSFADEKGHFEDWVEIYNRGDEAVSLAGYFLSDAVGRPWEHPLPDLMLPPGGRHIVFCDNALSEGPNHAPFRLSRRGETLVLSTLEAIVDRIDYPEIPADESYGRILDGNEEWRACLPASPGRANDCRFHGYTRFIPRVSTSGPE